MQCGRRNGQMKASNVAVLAVAASALLFGPITAAVAKDKHYKEWTDFNLHDPTSHHPAKRTGSRGGVAPGFGDRRKAMIPDSSPPPGILEDKFFLPNQSPISTGTPSAPAGRTAR
jgi:hypothetical protein